MTVRRSQRHSLLLASSNGGVAMGKKKGIPGFSFSWKRATGVTAAKAKIARELGVPLTKAGRQRKVGLAMGCCAPAAIILVGSLCAVGATGALVWNSVALAHGGGLNAKGCHTNRKTGDYHCHRAPATTPPPPPAATSLAPRRRGATDNARAQSADREYYANCSEVRDAGAAPVRRGDPGYAVHLDRDNDGIGCE